MVYVYDIECYHDLFLVVFISNHEDDDSTHIFTIYKDIDERQQLFDFLKHVKGLIGYNSISYDMQLIEFLYRNPTATTQELRNYSNIIVDSDNRRDDVPYYRFRIPNLDLYKLHHYDNKNRRCSLKWLEYSMDMENIEDLPSDGVGNNWLEQVTEYCINDVMSTKRLYLLSKKEIQQRKELSMMYNIDCMSWSNSKIGSELLLKLYCKKTGKFPNDVRSLRTYRDEIPLKDVIFDYISFNSMEFNSVLNFFKSKTIKNIKGEIEYSQVYKNFQFDYGAGGIHGSLQNRILNSDSKYVILDADVASLYPSIAIKNKLYPQHLGEEFCDVYENDIVAVRLAEKAKKELGNKTIVDGFKESANSVYGKSNDVYSWMYDTKYTLQTTINGQLLLSMLAEMLMGIKDLQLIQINTDGLTVLIDREKVDEYYEICKQWEKITQLQLEFAEYKTMIIRDVNNYISVYTNGKYKCKGVFEFENIPLHKNKSYSIIPKAIFEYFVNNKPVHETVYNHQNIFDFCAGVRSRSTEKSGKSWYELWSLDDDKVKQEKLSKTVRYFISKGGKTLMKCYENGSYEHVEAPLDLGRVKRHWKVTYFNKSWKADMKDYKIDYIYYIHKINEIIHAIEGNRKQTSLF